MKTDALTIAFIGGGNMAASLIGGLIAAGHPCAAIRVAEPDGGRAAALTERFGVRIAADNGAAVAGADVVVLATKPQQVEAALRNLGVEPGTAFLSIAAGVRVATLRALLGDEVSIVRTMPNTPALYGAGITGLYADAGTDAAGRRRAEYVLGTAGALCWVEREALLDVVTALSGSGPAYFFLVTEAIRDAGTRLGLDAAASARLALHTFAGSARMALESGVDVALLREQVTSTGGTTAAALSVLESCQLRSIFDQALAAAVLRGRQMGDELAARIAS